MSPHRKSPTPEGVGYSNNRAGFKPAPTCTFHFSLATFSRIRHRASSIQHPVSIILRAFLPSIKRGILGRSIATIPLCKAWGSVFIFSVMLNSFQHLKFTVLNCQSSILNIKHLLCAPSTSLRAGFCSLCELCVKSLVLAPCDQRKFRCSGGAHHPKSPLEGG